MTVDAEAITNLPLLPASVGLSSPAKDKGHVAPPSLTSLGSTRQAPPKLAVVDQEETRLSRFLFYYYYLLMTAF